jgi:arabinogalactan oligomer/maltooligosaccharide transport system substrate-binding protein
MEYIATESGMRDLYNADGRPSAWKSIFETSGGPDDLGFNAAGVAAVPMPSIPEMGYVWDAWVAAAALSFSGERTAAEALRNAKAQVESQSQ